MANCRLCGLDSLAQLYTPIGTRRQAQVYVCENCGLCQSVMENYRGDGVARISCDADFGNIRTGKLGREKNALRLFSQWGDTQPESILDVGASRGAFVKAALHQWAPGCVAFAVEPDESVWPAAVDSLIEHWDNRRIEDIDFEGQFDRIALIHTLEHLQDPLKQLKKLTGALKPTTGLMYIEVPNTKGVLLLQDIVEEYFIDKHVTHFSGITLMAMANAAGLRCLDMRADMDNLWVICARGAPTSPRPSAEASNIKRMVKLYKKNLELNRQQLRDNLGGVPPVIWGCGRILDALIKNGLDKEQIMTIIDTYVPFEDYEGIPVLRPDKMPEADRLLICSRSSAGQIAREARQLRPGIKINYWNERLKNG